MPHIIAKLAAGRSDRIKQELAERLTLAMTDVLGLDADAISIAMEDVPSQEWMERVYRPDIEGASAPLLKRPGYGPLASVPGDETGRTK